MALLKLRFFLLVASLPITLAPLAAPETGDVSTFYLGCDASLVPGTVRPDGSVNVRKMETTLFEGPSRFGGCWAHVAVQQFFVGVDRVYGLRSGQLNLIATESELAPTTEVGLELDAEGGHAGVFTGIHVETSLDGKTWTEFERGQYNLLRVNRDASRIPIPLLSGGGNGTYVVQSGPLSAGPLPAKDWYVLDFTAADTPFRFLRAYMGASATGGRTGYLDYLFGPITAVDLGPVQVPTLVEGKRNFSCGKDLLEDLDASHPCWYGDPCQVGLPTAWPCMEAFGSAAFVSHWNSVSSVHTYPIGEARIDRLRGSAALHPFRFNDPGQPDPDALAGHVNVQVSANGYAWTDVGSVAADYDRAEVEFDFPGLGGLEARFVRIVSDRHPDFDDFYAAGGTNAALRRFEAILLDSHVKVEGLVEPKVHPGANGIL